LQRRHIQLELIVDTLQILEIELVEHDKIVEQMVALASARLAMNNVLRLCRGLWVGFATAAGRCLTLF